MEASAETALPGPPGSDAPEGAGCSWSGHGCSGRATLVHSAGSGSALRPTTPQPGTSPEGRKLPLGSGWRGSGAGPRVALWAWGLPCRGQTSVCGVKASAGHACVPAQGSCSVALGKGTAVPSEPGPFRGAPQRCWGAAWPGRDQCAGGGGSAGAWGPTASCAAVLVPPPAPAWGHRAARERGRW